MDVVHLNQKQLAARWNISEASLERWRSEGIGPKFLKICGRVLYRQIDIEAYEESCLSVSTNQRVDRLSRQLKFWPQFFGGCLVVGSVRHREQNPVPAALWPAHSHRRAATRGPVAPNQSETMQLH